MVWPTSFMSIVEQRAKKRAWEAANRERIRELHRRNYQRHAAEYRAENKFYVEKFPEKHRARSLVYLHVKKGKLTRKPCEECALPFVEAHHDDYSKPLDVRWLCASHHMLLHAARRIAAI
jgi:hypothetical protein